MKIYTVQAAAELLSVTPYTIRSWARTGQLRGSRLGGGGSTRWRFQEEDIKEFLEAHRPEEKKPKGQKS